MQSYTTNYFGKSMSQKGEKYCIHTKGYTSKIRTHDQIMNSKNFANIFLKHEEEHR